MKLHKYNLAKLVEFGFLLLLTLVVCAAAQGQTFTVIHTFMGTDGAGPVHSLTADASGNLFGVTKGGGSASCGTVFEVSPRGGQWVENVIYSFQCQPDGQAPGGDLVFGPDGNLYGTTEYGGPTGCSGYDRGCGTIFKLRPPAHTMCGAGFCPWTETQLYLFQNDGDGAMPGAGLVFDHAGNLYGTFHSYGYTGVYQLAHSGSAWTMNIIWTMDYLLAGVIFDRAGNLYGTTTQDGTNGNGYIFQLTPGQGGWQMNTVYNFDSTAFNTFSNVIMDSAGNLYGTLTEGSNCGAGCIYELSPSGGNWNFNVLYAVPDCSQSCYPISGVVIDAAGNLYGTLTMGNPNYQGGVYKLTPSRNGWYETDLYDFTGGSDGGGPQNGVTLLNGKVYGTAGGGGGQSGVVWQITP